MARAPRLTRLGQGPAQAELRVVVHRVRLDDCLELCGRLRIVPRAKQRPAQGLANRALLRGLSGGLLQRNGGLLEVAVLEQLHAAPVKGIEGLGPLPLLVLGHWLSVKGPANGTAG